MSDIESLKESMTERHEVLTVLTDTLKTDLSKSLTGNKSAGTRLRKCLREIAKVSREMSKISLEIRSLTIESKD